MENPVVWLKIYLKLTFSFIIRIKESYAITTLHAQQEIFKRHLLHMCLRGCLMCGS